MADPITVSVITTNWDIITAIASCIAVLLPSIFIARDIHNKITKRKDILRTFVTSIKTIKAFIKLVLDENKDYKNTDISNSKLRPLLLDEYEIIKYISYTHENLKSSEQNAINICRKYLAIFTLEGKRNISKKKLKYISNEIDIWIKEWKQVSLRKKLKNIISMFYIAPQKKTVSMFYLAKKNKHK